MACIFLSTSGDFFSLFLVEVQKLKDLEGNNF